MFELNWSDSHKVLTKMVQTNNRTRKKYDGHATCGELRKDGNVKRCHGSGLPWKRRSPEPSLWRVLWQFILMMAQEHTTNVHRVCKARYKCVPCLQNTLQKRITVMLSSFFTSCVKGTSCILPSVQPTNAIGRIAPIPSFQQVTWCKHRANGKLDVGFKGPLTLHGCKTMQRWREIIVFTELAQTKC